jgi:hypothetical protein
MWDSAANRENAMTRAALIFILAVSGAVCAQAASRDRSIMLAQAAPGAPPEVCTEVYQPVCGTNPSGMRTTYSNACFARIARATNVTPGECPK